MGVNCRYDGENSLDEKVTRIAKEEDLVPVCPEQLGGLPTPRNRSNLKGDGIDVLEGKGKVVMEGGKDVTSNFLKGARETLKLARLFRARGAILKSRSPSCGLGKIPKAPSGELVEGDGVTAALLRENGLELISEENL